MRMKPRRFSVLSLGVRKWTSLFTNHNRPPEEHPTEPSEEHPMRCLFSDIAPRVVWFMRDTWAIRYSYKIGAGARGTEHTATESMSAKGSGEIRD